jgi:hypothetical protein
MSSIPRAALAVLVAAIMLSVAAPASAYDTGPHFEITEDAMRAEGFNPDSVGVAQVNNWFVDFYEQADSNPFSGHGGFLKRLLSGAIVTEGWSDEVIEAAQRAHFDSSTSTLFNSAGMTAEWDRLRRAVYTLVQEARAEDDRAKLLAVLGMSLHQVQDFYTHTNWIEPESGLGAEGPGWQARGYGSSPTWFDVPTAVRDDVTVYTANTQGHPRQHGTWNTDGNTSLTSAMAKDWPGRPLYLQSAITSYFASRQWIQAVRSWVGDDAFWGRAQGFRANQRHLDHDLDGAYKISLYSGHWQGQGEPLGGERGPGGSLISLRQAIKHYFQPTFNVGNLRGRSEYRSRFEGLIRRMSDANPPGQIAPVPSSQELQRTMRVVVLRVLDMRGRGLGDPGPDDADMYANVRIDGQPMTSAVIHGHDRYSFPNPNEPFTWIKAVPAVPNAGEPVESVEVEIKTGDVRFAGTNDDVFVRLGQGLRFNLDKRLYDDFERGDRDTYSVPIDDAVRRGMRVGDIRELTIQKARDGVAGGWRLGGVKLFVNGRPLYSKRNINRWLEDDRRTFTAPDFVRSAPRGTKIPVWLRLDEDDLVYGGDDDGDINPFDKRRTVAVGYAPGPPLQVTTTGGGRLGGRLDDGNEATVTFRLETVTPETIREQPAPPPPPPPPPAVLRPDLVVTSFFFNGVTVKNQGSAAAGPFRLRAGDAATSVFASFAGLAPGESATRALGLTCGPAYVALVDDQSQVVESDEANNTRGSDPTIC